jgi:hypothetical protein
VNRLGALDALGRGISNVRANWEVVIAAAVGGLLSLVLMLLSLLPWLSAFGISARQLLAPREPGVGDLFGSLAGALDPRELLTKIGAGVLAFLLALLLVSVLYAWYYGGMLGVLVAGDAQAPAGAHRAPPVFRTWSWRLFLSEATRLTWKVMLYLSAVLTLLMLAIVLALLLVLLVVVVSHGRGSLAAFAVGCGGMLPILFAMLAIYGAGCVGLGELARPGGGVRSALRLGFRVFGQRLGACLALMVLFVMASLVVGLLCGGIELLFSGAGLARRAAVEGVTLVAQVAAGALLGSVFMASCVALLRSETSAGGGAATT